MTRTPAEPVSTAAALRGAERRFARRGLWLVALLGLAAAAGPLMAHVVGAGLAALLTAGLMSGVFLALLGEEQVLDQLASQAQGLGRLAAFHDAAILLAAPPAPRAPLPPPAPGIRGRALASLTLTPKLLPRPIAARAHARS